MLLAYTGRIDDATDALKHTLKRVNEASNWLSQRVCNELRTTNTVKIHHDAYYTLREQFQLPANFACVVIRRVANAYKCLDTKQRFKKPIEFRSYAAIELSKDLFAFRHDGQLGITTTDSGRINCTVRWNRAIDFARARKTLVLSYRPDINTCFVSVLIETDEPQPYTPADWIGVDLGIANIAVSSDGTVYGGEELIHKKEHYRTKRKQLQKRKAKNRKQKRDTHSARRRLNSIRRRERNFTKNTLHTISKRVVAHAKALSRGIALEDLKRARERITVSAGRQHRIRISGWAYRQLQQYIAYKAQLAGVPVIWVSAKHTSRTCPECGYCDKRNRPSQAVFRCLQCGYGAHADFVAARNLALRAWGANPRPQMPSVSYG